MPIAPIIADTGIDYSRKVASFYNKIWHEKGAGNAHEEIQYAAKRLNMEMAEIKTKAETENAQHVKSFYENFEKGRVNFPYNQEFKYVAKKAELEKAQA